MSDDRPLVVTLALAEPAQERLDALRRRWFPPERNHLGAHVTLFHALPGHGVDRVRALLRQAAAREAFDVEVAAVRRLGRGVALDLRSSELGPLHRGLRAAVVDAFGEEVTAQDRQGLRAHVTVANKLDAGPARTAYEAVSAGFSPWTAPATGLALWRYDGGPWRSVGVEGFTPAGAGPGPGAARAPAATA